MSTWASSDHGHTLTRGRITITDQARKPLTSAQLVSVANLVWDLYRTNPPTRRRGPIMITIIPADDPRLGDGQGATDDDGWTGAMTDIDTGEMVINERSFHEMGDLRNFMPVAGHVPGWVYTITHEWGHEVTPSLRLERNAQKLELDFWVHEDDLPPYGHSDPAEAYAEAFAEYVLSDGKTINGAARDYATEYGFKIVDVSPSA